MVMTYSWSEMVWYDSNINFDDISRKSWKHFTPVIMTIISRQMRIIMAVITTIKIMAIIMTTTTTMMTMASTKMTINTMMLLILAQNTSCNFYEIHSWHTIYIIYPLIVLIPAGMNGPPNDVYIIYCVRPDIWLISKIYLNWLNWYFLGVWLDRDCHLPTNTIHLAVVDVLFAVWQKLILIVVNYFIFCGNCNWLLFPCKVIVI